MFCQSYSNILIKLIQTVIFEPDDIGKTYIPQKKALNRGRYLENYSELSFEVHNSFLCHLAGFLSLMRILEYDW